MRLFPLEVSHVLFGEGFPLLTLFRLICIEGGAVQKWWNRHGSKTVQLFSNVLQYRLLGYSSIHTSN